MCENQEIASKLLNPNPKGPSFNSRILRGSYITATTQTCYASRRLLLWAIEATDGCRHHSKEIKVRGEIEKRRARRMVLYIL